MTETQGTFPVRRSKHPGPQLFPGIIFAVIYGTSMVLLNVSLSQETATGLARTVTDPRTVALALNLIPYRRDCFSLVHWRDSRSPGRK